MAQPDDDLPFDDDDILSLHGVTVPQTDEPIPPVVETQDDDPPATLTLKPWDEMPGRDFQPRLLRFGEAA